MFIDKVTVEVRAGNGGDGAVSFRHEKFIDRGGPDGGDGGNGGDVILQASNNQNTLAQFRYQKEVTADDGQGGSKQKKHGKSAKPLVIMVPVGTVATTENGQLLADLTTEGQRAVIAKGGKGGFGNAHFVSSRRQTPKFRELGEPGDELSVTLELKLIADVGLVGLPNAGKSTLLARISNAKPEIANYPFTTLTPNLGVVDVEKNSLLFADIPGLIEGAAEGKGLGHEFLRHIERTAVIVHLIDAYDADVVQSYQTVAAELRQHDAKLAKRPTVVALNKTEGLDPEIVADLLDRLQEVTPKGTLAFAISAQAGINLQALLYTVRDMVTKARSKAAARTKKAAPKTVPVLKLAETAADWKVVKTKAGFEIRGRKLEQFARRTDFSNDEGVGRLRDILQRSGVMHELIRRGVKAGSVISFPAGEQFEY